jgi:putative oxidoreductase
LGQTQVFLFRTLIAGIVIFAAIVANRSVARSQAMARSFYLLAAGLSFAALLCILLGVAGLLPETAGYAALLQLLIYRGWLVIGTAISVALLMLVNADGDSTSRLRSETVRGFITSPLVLKGICLSVAISFLCTEIGKAAHDAEMRQFFVQSGYPIWFLYFIMGAETAGAIGLLLPRTILPAALGLTVVMLGAIRTHLHNRDPFSDSLEALHLLVLLGCILVIVGLRCRVAGARSMLVKTARGIRS